jgi:aryl-alcohol dehydrogenase (NADP+)
MLPLCADEGIGVIPWSPLARGRLTRPWDAKTSRSETDVFGQSLYQEGDADIVARVADVAGKRAVSPAQIALAWMLTKPAVTSPIIGATKPAHLADAIAALDVDLSEDEVAFVEEPYQPHRVAGFR